MDDNIRKNIDTLVLRVGEPKFLSSALLNQSIQALSRGAEPIDIITQLIEIIDNQNIELTKYVTQYGTNHKK